MNTPSRPKRGRRPVRGNDDHAGIYVEIEIGRRKWPRQSIERICEFLMREPGGFGWLDDQGRERKFATPRTLSVAYYRARNILKKQPEILQGLRDHVDRLAASEKVRQLRLKRP